MRFARSLLLSVAASSLLLVGCTGSPGASVDGTLLPAASCPDPAPWHTALHGIGAGTVVFDSQCNLVIAGEIDDPASASLGSEKIDLPKGWFAMKIAGDGKVAWAKSFGEFGQIGGTVTVAAAGGGDVVVAGDFSGSIPLASGKLVAGAEHSFVARLDGKGDARWGRLIPGDVVAVAVDLGSDEPVVAGTFTGTVDAGGTSLVSAGGTDVFVLRLDGADGSTRSGAAIGGKTNEGVASIAVATDGGLAISGGWGMPASTLCDEGGCTQYDDRQPFVALLDGSGKIVWKKDVGEHGAVAPGGPVAASPNGDVLAWEWDAPTFHVFGNDGTERWSKTVDTLDSLTTGTAARFDASGDVVLGGYFFSGSRPDFGGGPVAAQTGQMNGFLAKLDSDGGFVFSTSFDNVDISSLDVTAGGAIAVANGNGIQRFGARTLAAH